MAHALKCWRLPRKCVMFTDKGTCFQQNGESIVCPDYAAVHEPYPPIAHHVLSVNDNKLHSGPKRKWLNDFTDYRDDWTCSLSLLKDIQDTQTAMVQQWYETNFQLLKPQLRLQDLDGLVKGWNSKLATWYSFFEECEGEYHEFLESSKGPIAKRTRAKK